MIGTWGFYLTNWGMKMTTISSSKAIPVQAWTDPEGFRMLRLPEFLDNRHMKVVRYFI
jgi:hypothetical protein